MKLAIASVVICLLPKRVVCSVLGPSAVVQLSERDTTSTCTAVESPAPSDLCGARGTLGSHTYPSADSQMLDKATCAKYCSDMNTTPQLQACGSFTFNPSTSICTFYANPPYILGFKKNARSPTQIYDIKKCYTCNSNPCSAGPGFNYFNNPNFELSTSLAWPWGIGIKNVNVTIIPNPVGQGNALRLSIDSQNQTSQSVYQSRSVCATDDYLVSVDYKLDQLLSTPAGANTSAVALTIEATVGAQALQDYIQYTLGDSRLGSWHTLQYSVPGTDFTGFSIVGYRSTTTPMQWALTVANFRVEILPPIKTRGASLIANGGFESGSLAPWTTDTYVAAPYYTTQTYECPPNEPFAAVVSPGLPATKHTPASQHKYSFCGTTGPAPGSDASSLVATVTQPLARAPAQDTLYVLTLAYRVFNASSVIISLGEFLFLRQVDEFPGTLPTTLRVEQRIFPGQGEAVPLQVMVNTDIYAQGEVTSRIFLDSVSIRPLASWAHSDN